MRYFFYKYASNFFLSYLISFLLSSPENYCGPVKPIKNGRVLNATGVLVGDVAQYSCVDGYTITGKKIVKCQENGQWETAPVCSGEREGTFMSNGCIHKCDTLIQLI